MSDFLRVMKKRRSCYAIGNTSPVPDETLEELLKQALLHTPSAFHMQSARLLLLLGSPHRHLWRIAADCLEPVVAPQQWKETQRKLASFAAGYGTVLFLEDSDTVEQYAEQYNAYREQFPVWAQQANGMLQFAVWNLLEEAGLGASLQHYNPLIDEPVRKAWDLPGQWRMIAQMPFGAPTGSPDGKQFMPAEQRIIIHK